MSLRRGRRWRGGRSRNYLRLQLIELARRPDPEVLLARLRERKASMGTRLPADRILTHTEADRR
jgi:antitoxin FitA